jgi:hypothetical protein
MVMFKWIVRLLFVGVLGWLGYGAYDYFRAGLHTRPEMPDGAFSISYANGLRAILTGVPNEEEARRYFGFPQEVEDRNMPGERFEVVCKVTADEDVVVRGVITSVPKL